MRLLASRTATMALPCLIVALPHLEGQAMSVGCECDVRHQIFLILPHEDGIVRRTIRIVVDIRVGDRRIEVIYEGLQYVRSASLRSVGRSVRTSVLDSMP